MPHEAIRWERLAFPIRPGEPIAIRRDTPFSRFAAVDLPQDTAPEDTRFHLFVAIASPAPDEIAKFEVAPIEVADECAAILDACQDLLRNGQMQITFLPGKTGLPPEFGISTGLPHIRVLDGFTTAERIADSSEHGSRFTRHRAWPPGQAIQPGARRRESRYARMAGHPTHRHVAAAPVAAHLSTVLPKRRSPARQRSHGPLSAAS